MRYRPHLSDATIAALLESKFGLATRELAFLPVGEDGWAYRATDANDGRDWFVQLRQHSVENTLAVTTYLSRRAGLDWIPPALQALDGGLSVDVGGLHLCVYPFIEGIELIGKPLLPAVARRVGRMLAKLHAARLPARLRVGLPVETYARHQETARRVLSAAGGPHPPASLQASLAAFIRVRAAEIERIILRAQRLGDALRLRSSDCVLCHADIHDANILEDEAGRLWVIDWDGLMLAPPERDLFFWHDSGGWEDFRAGYASVRPVDEDLIRYYTLEWVVQEIADYGENVFFLPLSEEQKAHALEEFKLLFEAGGLVEGAQNAPPSPLERV